MSLGHSTSQAFLPILSSSHPKFLAWHQNTRRKIRDYQATDQRARNAQFRDEVGGRRVVTRGSQGKNITKTMIMAINRAADTSSCPRTP